MALTTDVVVVGGGLAGACAALAAREAGADVLLVARAPGGTAMSSGAIDFAGAEDDAPIGEAARKLARAAPGHPYALLGDGLVPAIDDALAFLQRHLSALGLSGARTAADRNLWLATPLGRAKPAALAQGGIAAGDLRNLAAREARLGVVALAGAQAIEARLVAKGLTPLLAPLCEAVVVAPDFYRQRGDALRTLPEIAQDLDRPGRRAALGASLGLRLQRALQAALEKSGVRSVAAIAERSSDGQVQIVRGVECEPVRAGSVVLASGRFLGGGIRCEADGRLRETVFDLPARAAGRDALAALPNERLFAERAAGPHPGLAAGVEADSELRSGAAFVCGAVLGGFDPARDEGGLGVCAVTGLVAGRRAARAAGKAGASAPAGVVRP